jgi:hypothetical protein
MLSYASRQPSLTLLTVLVLALVPALASANWLGGIEFSQPTPAYMQNDENVYVDIDYHVTDAGGARIFILPYTDGAPTPDYGVQGSTLVPAGTGTVSRFFRILSGSQHVDHVKVSMTNADQSVQYVEIFVRASFFYGPSGIFNIQYDQAPYSCLMYGDDLNINFDYATSEAADVRIYARPITDGELSPGYSASGSALLPPSGSYSQHFTFPDTDADVDHVRFQMWNGDQTEMLLEIFLPVDFLWRQVGITNLVYSTVSPASLHHDTDVTVSFDYHHDYAGNVLIWIQAFYNGGYAPNSHYQGSVPVAPGSGSTSRYFGVHEGATPVNQVRVLVRDADQTEDLVNYLIPADYFWAAHAINNIQLTPDAPAILDYDENLDITFDYQTSHPGDVLIFARPFNDGALAPNYVASGSPSYPSGSGSGDGYFGFPNSDQEVDQIRFQMKNADQTELLLEYFVDTTHFWGFSGTVTPVGNITPQLTSLGRNYPNPFNPTTTIPITVGVTDRIRVNIYDMRGRLVEVLADEVMAAGVHELTFDGRNLASGTYFYRLEGAGVTQSQRMTLVK